MVERLLEKQDTHHSKDDSHIRNVPDREKCEVLAAEERDRVREIAPPDIHMNEIHHATLEERFAVEDRTIEYTVDDVAEGTSKDEGEAQSVRSVACSNAKKVGNDNNRREDREIRNQGRRAKRDPESHSGILGIGEAQPFTDQGDRLRPIHGLHHDHLGHLIQQDDES